MPRGFVTANHVSKLHPDSTIDSSSRTKYRHFSVDPLNNVVYFCDRNPYREGMHCYSSLKDGSTGTNSWHGQHHITDLCSIP